MSLPDLFKYHFYPVGQGLFSTGSIHRSGEDTSRFLWVYDCGTSSSPTLVDRGIARLHDWAGIRPRIDLLTLSHFDQDHISGVVRLLKTFRIGTLMLPYMPLAQRLALAFEEGGEGTNEPMTRFCINPVAYLRAQEGATIERILFVPPSGEQGPPSPGIGPTRDSPQPEGPPELIFRTDGPPSSSKGDPALNALAGTLNQAGVEFLPRGAAITVTRCGWEFVPYNDDTDEPISTDFVALVDAETSSLTNAQNETERDTALKRLKAAYDGHFGSGSVERNVISLFLYSGPVYETWQACDLEGQYPWYIAQRRFWRRHTFPGSERRRSGCSILYTGDGYLDSTERLQKLIAYLSQVRVDNIKIFQVMHHGSESNWHKGVAKAFSPDFSVFSSDPNRKRWHHPHAPVLRDFWQYGAVQVDTESSFTTGGFLD